MTACAVQDDCSNSSLWHACNTYHLRKAARIRLCHHLWGKPHRPHNKALPCILSRMVALHHPPRRCFGTQRPCMAIRYISPAKRLTALQVQRTRSALSGSIWLITAQIVPVVRRRAYFWCCKRDSNPHVPGYKPGALPDELLQQDIRRWVMKTGEYFLERDK